MVNSRGKYLELLEMSDCKLQFDTIFWTHMFIKSHFRGSMFGIGVRKKHGRQTQFQKRFGPIVTVLVILPSKLPYLMYFSLDMPMTKNLILNTK